MAPSPNKAYSGGYTCRIRGKVWTFSSWSYETDSTLYDMCQFWDVSNEKNPTSPCLLYRVNMGPWEEKPHKYANFLKTHFHAQIVEDRTARNHYPLEEHL
jgi:hypothetical protein